jgi:hypothetical protein
MLWTKILDGLKVAGQWFTDHVWQVIVGIFIGGLLMWVVGSVFGCEPKPQPQTDTTQLRSTATLRIRVVEPPHEPSRNP